MIYLFTGTPGAGKTLNAIKFIDTDDRLKGRPVYYYNVDDCKMTGWTSLTLDQLYDWQSLPTGSVVFVDEAYKFAPVGPTGVKPADHIEKLAEHRHAGIDFVFVCQHPTQLHTFLRKMVGNHYHVERQFGFQRSRILEWQKVVNDPDDHFARKDAISRQVSFDKKYFSAYKSAEIHTHKPKIPMKLIILGVLLSSIAIGGWAFVDKIKNRDDLVRQSASLPTESMPYGSEKKVSVLDAVSANLPRIPDQPWTAPIYDELRKPKTFPKPSCVHNTTKNECRCYSQQGTRLEMSARSCVDIVRYGWFDNTKSDDSDQDKKRGEAGRQALPPSPRQHNSRLVPNSQPARLSSID